MVVIGVDTHKATHTCVAVDAVGRKLAEVTVRATTEGHLKALRWARDVGGPDAVWGIEDCRNLSLRLEHDLLDANQTVVRVPPKLMARTRASARTPGKSDPIDALAVARAVLREPDLPMAHHDEVSREIKLLVDRREDLVAYRTAVTNRFLWRVHELDPSRAPKLGTLDTAKHQATLRDWLDSQTGLVAELASDELADITALTEQINRLHKRIGALVKTAAPSLLAIYGCADLTAAKIIGETAGVSRFRSEAAYARHAGVAPIPHWSGSTENRSRATHSGNRQLNKALYRIALTQIRRDGPAGQYYRKRREGGDSHAGALRRIERRIVRTVFGRLRAEERRRSVPQTPPQTCCPRTPVDDTSATGSSAAHA
ncbi:IS110 family transposase (plasmid) [Mycobacterium sp. Aquia_216]|uniref:IS110 family transposase n=1 Tax=Mycobacterium sp. Aquia_216 TaxID=2991729 RepID=UPI00227B6AD1|nr:IS110 family transposase [Mycobacterium sp. Aquia_216]WAJ47968.1 IS110 family transposase [Mycobacterium sp. Aquia_216]